MLKQHCIRALNQHRELFIFGNPSGFALKLLLFACNGDVVVVTDTVLCRHFKMALSEFLLAVLSLLRFRGGTVVVVSGLNNV